MLSLGVITARDEWVYDNDAETLAKKIEDFITKYNKRKEEVGKLRGEELTNDTLFGDEIKWSRALMARALSGGECKFIPKHIIRANFRPFMKQYLYFDPQLNEVQYQLNRMYHHGEPNPSIAFMSIGSSNPLSALGIDGVFDYCFLKKGNGGTQAVSRWFYDKSGCKESNITDWGVNLFQRRYASERNANVTEDAIFYYVYAALHDPVYKTKYSLDLRKL
jgi:predicted helicase